MALRIGDGPATRPRFSVLALSLSFDLSGKPRARPELSTRRAIASGSAPSPSAALSNQTAALFSDLLVHHMGIGLADGITQGAAGPDEFRTAPLWGVGQRVFFLHDGRTSDIVTAIRDHASEGSEANRVVQNFRALSAADQQDLVNFLRSL